MSHFTPEVKVTLLLKLNQDTVIKLSRRGDKIEKAYAFWKRKYPKTKIVEAKTQKTDPA